MKISVITPARPGSRKGNRVTALRWARLLRELGHCVRVCEEYRGEACDVLVALHARRSFAAVAAFHHAHPDRPIIVALTGTDLYDEIHRDATARQSLEMAWRLIVLQPLGTRELPPRLRGKTRVIIQSAEVPRVAAGRSRAGTFDVCVLGHLRAVKDPFRTAQAARLLPPSSRIRVLHVGAALSNDMARDAKTEAARNPRYRWLGSLPRGRALRVLAHSRLLVLTSVLEGGANVISEALAASVPVLASRIPGSIGLLGAGYPGFFRCGDTKALAALLSRAETDPAFYKGLKTWCRKLRPLVRPTQERESWRRLLGELAAPSAGKKRG
jgi:putative glycosyltransferase (TIGR04348 family)